MCEICGSNDLLKDNGVFVCQHCGTKYSVEEAKKIMSAEKVDVSGSTVKVDHTDRLANLYALAHRALEAGDLDSAHSYYKEILLEDPSSWEAVIFAPCTKRNGKKAELREYGIQMMRSIPQALELIKENIPDEQQLNAVRRVARCSENYAIFIAKNVQSHLEHCFVNNIQDNATPWLESYYVAADIQHSFGQFTLLYFSAADDEIEELITNSIESAMSLLQEYVCNSIYFIGISRKPAKEKIRKYAQTIHSYNCFYPVPEEPAGCYVATAVYGSYDCPQVWTLRRFRDHTLATTWYGRAFIRTYYATSPTLVKWFGETAWFKTFFRIKLDKMVDFLQRKGVESTPYQDADW